MTLDDLLEDEGWKADEWIGEAHRDQLLEVLQSNLEGEAEAFDRRSLEEEFIVHQMNGVVGYNQMDYEDLRSEVRRLLREARI